MFSVTDTSATLFLASAPRDSSAIWVLRAQRSRVWTTTVSKRPWAESSNNCRKTGRFEIEPSLSWLKDSGQAIVIKEASFAKLFATEAASRIVDESLQIHGGAGLERGNRIERLYRDIRILTIYEGTSEIQRRTIARQLLREQG